MMANLTKLQIAYLVLMALVLASLGHDLYRKVGHISACHGQLAQIKLLDARLDASETQLDAVEARLNSIKR